MSDYRYPHFRRQLLLEDMSFTGDPEPGEAMLDFDLPTTDQGRSRRDQFLASKPLLLTLGSIT